MFLYVKLSNCDLRIAQSQARSIRRNIGVSKWIDRYRCAGAGDALALIELDLRSELEHLRAVFSVGIFLVENRALCGNRRRTKNSDSAIGGSCRCRGDRM